MDNHRVLLIGPEHEENLSLRYLAAALQAKGILWQIAPFNTADDTKSVLSQISRFKPSIVGISMAFQYRAYEMLELVKIIHQQFPECHITAGGHFASLRAKELLTDYPALSSVVRSEGEDPICKLTEVISCGGSLADVPNLVFRDKDGCIIENPVYSKFPDLDTQTWPVRPLHPEVHAGIKSAHLLGSRGCYHSSCRYCCIAAFHSMKQGQRYALRSAKSIVEEMLSLYKREIRVFFFHDDNFFLRDEQQNIERLSELKTEMTASGIGDIRIYVKSRPSTITPGTISALQNLGVGGLFIGVENHADSASDYLGRNERQTHREQALSLLKEADLLSNYNMLLFNPYSTPQDISCNLDFIAENLEIPFNFCRVEVYAGTPLEAEMSEKGKLAGSYLSWDYTIDDPRIERMLRWSTGILGKRQFEYRGLMNQNITLGYYADIITYFFPGPVADRLKQKIRRICKVVNTDTLDHLRGLLDLTLDDGISEQTREERISCIRKRVEAQDRRLYHDLISMRRKLENYSLVCSWASHLHLCDSQSIDGPVFEKLFAVD
ncbi:MAG: B12-binding domain-containing radical SAM protein [Armatimonadota bacterium]